MNKLEFISYDGKYPNLCRGILRIRLNGKIITFPQFILQSGRDAYFINNYDSCINYGPWSLREDYIPTEFPKELLSELINIINENIPFGCCGGCL